MKKGWKHMDSNELSQVEILLAEGYSLPRIAKRLSRSKNTLYELCKNNGVEYGVRRKSIGPSWSKTGRWKWKKIIQFQSLTVHNKRKARRSLASKRYCRIPPWWILEKYILQKIVESQWSPEQISGRWNLETSERLSKDTIYRYVYSTHRELIKKFFRRKGKCYQHNRQNKCRIMDRRMIERRPKIIEKRLHIWHWEWDTIVGRKWGSNQVILTNVERKTGYLLARKLQRWTAENVCETTRDIFDTIPKYKRKTITYDNGKEFSEHRLIEYFTKTKVYFAHPYHSWERATNENTNGLLRQYLPKKTDFSSCSSWTTSSWYKSYKLPPEKATQIPHPHLKYLRSGRVAFGFGNCTLRHDSSLFTRLE